jgi:hypothetical protein
MNKKRNSLALLLLFLAILLAACGSDANSAEAEPGTATENTQVVPPTNTPLQPTDTPIPPTATAEPATATPEPPTSTPEPPTPTPEPPTPTPLPELSAEDLYGRWGHILFTLALNSDGTYIMLWPSEPEDEQPQEIGTYDLAEGVITFRPDTYELTGAATIDGCDNGKTYAYAASFSNGDSRFLKLIDGSDTCEYRARQWSQEPVWQLLEKYSAE